MGFEFADMVDGTFCVFCVGESFVVALGVVAWCMTWVRRRGLLPFAIYRVVAGAAVLLWLARAGG